MPALSEESEGVEEMETIMESDNEESISPNVDKDNDKAVASTDKGDNGMKGVPETPSSEAGETGAEHIRERLLSIDSSLSLKSRVHQDKENQMKEDFRFNFIVSSLSPAKLTWDILYVYIILSLHRTQKMDAINYTFS